MSIIRPPLTYPLPWEHLSGRAYVAATRRGASNGAHPDVGFWQQMVDAYNFIVGRQLRVLPAKLLAYAGTSALDANNAPRWRWRYRSTQNGSVLMASVACGPAATAATAPDYSWDAGVTPHPFDVRDDAGVEADVRPLAPGTGEIVDAAVTRNNVEDVIIYTDDGLRLCGVTLWEQPRATLDTAADLVLNPALWRGGRPITNSETGAWLDALEELYEKFHHHHIAWNVDIESAPIVRTAAGEANIFDQTKVAYAAENPGFPIDIAYSASVSSATLPIQCAAYVGGMGDVVFRTASASASVTGTGAPAWKEATLAAAPTDTKIDVFIDGDGVAPTAVFAISAWTYLGV